MGFLIYVVLVIVVISTTVAVMNNAPISEPVTEPKSDTEPKPEPKPEPEPTTIELDIQTDKGSYQPLDRILVTGSVSHLSGGVAVVLQVFDANGNLVTIQQPKVTVENEFRAVLTAGGPLWKTSGTYTIKAFYGNIVQQTYFEYSGGIIEPVSQTIQVSASDLHYDHVVPGEYSEIYSNWTVVDGDGNPVSGATVNVTLTAPDGQKSYESAITGSDGIVEFTHTIYDYGKYGLQVTEITGTSLSFTQTRDSWLVVIVN